MANFVEVRTVLVRPKMNDSGDYQRAEDGGLVFEVVDGETIFLNLDNVLSVSKNEIEDICDLNLIDGTIIRVKARIKDVVDASRGWNIPEKRLGGDWQ